MGVLLALYRKLSLRRRIDTEQYQLMMLSEQQRTVQRQISEMQENKTQKESIWNDALSCIATNADSIFQQQMMGTNQNSMNAQNNFTRLNQQLQAAQNPKEGTAVDEEAVKKLKGDVETAQNTAYNAQAASSQATMQMAYQRQAFMQQLTTMKNSMTQAMDNSDKQTLSQLHNKDTEYSQKITNLESMLTKDNEEYKNADALCKEEAKNTSPKFGL